MAEKKSSDWSTCFEKLPFAEMMREMMSRQGIGSLCAEIMKNARQQESGCTPPCSDMMRETMKISIKAKEEARYAKRK